MADWPNGPNLDRGRTLLRSCDARAICTTRGPNHNSYPQVLRQQSLHQSFRRNVLKLVAPCGGLLWVLGSRRRYLALHSKFRCKSSSERRSCARAELGGNFGGNRHCHLSPLRAFKRVSGLT